MFQNLIGNAVAHHDRPGDGCIRVSASDADGFWRLEVADDGPGIAAEVRERVFEMFTSSGKQGHSGIGLAVVRKIVTGRGGRIEATDNAPRGGLIHLWWPK